MFSLSDCQQQYLLCGAASLSSSPDNRAQGAQCLIYRRGIRKILCQIRIDQYEIRSLGISCRVGILPSVAEIIFRQHLIIIRFANSFGLSGSFLHNICATKRCSPIECRGSSTIPPRESPNVLDASSKLTPCFALFIAAFPGSHSKTIIQKLPELFDTRITLSITCKRTSSSALV